MQTSPPQRQQSGTSCPEPSPWRLSRYLFISYRTPACRPHRRAAQVTATTGHVDNPADRVKFRRLDKTAAIMSRTKSSQDTGRIRWRLPRNKPRSNSPKALRRRAGTDRAADAQAQRHPAGALRSRPRADDADQEHPRRSVLHHLSHRARGGSRRHRLRRLDGRHARRGADADLAALRRWPTCWPRWRSPTRSR